MKNSLKCTFLQYSVYVICEEKGEIKIREIESEDVNKLLIH